MEATKRKRTVLVITATKQQFTVWRSCHADREEAKNAQSVSTLFDMYGRRPGTCRVLVCGTAWQRHDYTMLIDYAKIAGLEVEYLR